MGFASGFGDAFAQSYGQARQLKARKEENEYEWRMKGLFEEREARTKLEAKTKKAQADAKSISEQTGAPLKEVYSRLLDGMDYDAAYKWGENGDWSGVKYNGGSLDPMTVPDPQSLDSEMTGSGLAAAESPVNETGTSTRVSTDEGSVPYKRKPKVLNPDEQIDNLKREYSLSTTSPERKNAIAEELRGFGEASQLVNPRQETTGATKADLIRAIASKKPNSPERMEAQAALDMYTQTEADQGLLSGGEQIGTVLDEDGNRKVTVLKPVRTERGVGLVPRGSNAPAEGAAVMGEDEKKAYEEFQKSSNSPEVVKQVDKVVGLTGMLRSSARLQRIVDKDEGVLPGVTGAAVDLIDSARKEFQAATNLFGVELKKNGAGEIEASSMDALQKKVDSIDVSAITDRAELRDLFNAEMNLLVYRAGAALGQSGQAFSGKDFNLISSSLRGSTSAPAFKDNINSYMKQQIQNVEDSAQALSGVNSAALNYKDTYGYLPIRALPSPGDFIASRIGEGDARDEELQAGYLSARQAKAFSGIEGKTPNTPATSTPNVKNDDGWTSTPNGTKFRRVQ